MLILTFHFPLYSQDPALIPQPMETAARKGNFHLSGEVILAYDHTNAELTRIAGFLNDYLGTLYGMKLGNEGKGKTIQLKIMSSLNTGKEGYLLRVDKNGVVITASAPNGIFYGIQTLRQLIPADAKPDSVLIPAIEIKDQPRFAWRGNMLDCGRHFFPVSFLKKYIDILALYKINTFHWHLTEDQGWRLEVKKYPALTEIAHWRNETVVGHARNSKTYDGIGYGGFYTQEQVKELVKYAADRYINIVPEIEMPGHSSAALTAYPNLGCMGGPYKVQTTWGVHKDVFCAGKEETFTFLQNVLDEVLAVFPSEFIHIGGDECPKDAWKKCPDCQKKIKELGLKDEHELQSYFITRMDKYLSSKGRRLIGWDEILEGGLAPQATVMSWRGIKGGIEAAKQKHQVVMTPTTHMYFDYYQSEQKESEPLAIGGFLPVNKVYSFEPIPVELTPEESKYVIGVQSNLWTEYVPNTGHAEYMLLPRLAAMSELAWTPAAKKDFTGFEKRLIEDYKRLGKLGINYRDHRK